MEFSEKGMANFSSDLEKDLIEFMNLPSTLGFQQMTTMGPTAWLPGGDKVAELIRQARRIANKYNPQSFTVSVGIPLGAQISLTFEAGTKGVSRSSVSMQ